MKSVHPHRKHLPLNNPGQSTPVGESRESRNAWSGSHSESGACWNVHCGDAKTVLRTLPRFLYQCVITSPPYFWQRDYGVPGQLGIEESVEGYVKAIVGVMDEVKEVMKSEGILFLNLGDTYYSGKGKPQGKDKKHTGRRFLELRAVDRSGLGHPKKTLLGMPWRVALAMIDRNWILRSAIIWRRDNVVPEPNVRDRPWRTYEHIFVFAKSQRYLFNREALQGNAAEDVWTIESQSKAGREHPAVFPKELVSKCLELGNAAKGAVLDPFAGSGTVIREALSRGMAADGIDLNRKYCESLVQSLKSA